MDTWHVNFQESTTSLAIRVILMQGTIKPFWIPCWLLRGSSLSFQTISWAFPQRRSRLSGRAKVSRPGPARADCLSGPLLSTMDVFPGTRVNQVHASRTLLRTSHCTFVQTTRKSRALENFKRFRENLDTVEAFCLPHIVKTNPCFG